jgi:uracil phosphoribosyltransferase
MSIDVQHERLQFRLSEIPHHYGEGVHILSDPLSLQILGKLCAHGTVQPEVGRLLIECYRTLVHNVIAHEFPRRRMEVTTRMVDHTPRGVWVGEGVDPRTPAIVVAVARAGLVPSQITFDYLVQFIDPQGVRQDHLVLERALDASGRVTGARMFGSKIGGSIDGAFVLVPDPMGATGSTVTRVLEQYRERGRPARIIAVHLIITPEYLRHVRTRHPEVVVYALRLDRGLSSDEVLATVPGTRWQDEQGLNEHQYIVPGAGGMGEVINNAFV